MEKRTYEEACHLTRNLYIEIRSHASEDDCKSSMLTSNPPINTSTPHANFLQLEINVYITLTLELIFLWSVLRIISDFGRDATPYINLKIS